MKTIFWNVDTQYDFMRKDGKLYVEGAEAIEGALYHMTRIAYDKNIKVINTADWHHRHSKEISGTPDFISTFPQHCMQNTPGAELIPATKPTDPYIVDWQAWNFDPYELEHRHRNIIVYKDAFDVFTGNKHASSIVDLLKPDRAFVYGVATNVCVNYAVLGLLKRGVEVYVVKDAIKELPKIPLEPIIENWKAKGAKFTTTKELEELL